MAPGLPLRRARHAVADSARTSPGRGWRSPAVVARPHQPVLVGPDDGLDPIPELELAQHGRDMGLHRRLADLQAAGDLAVGLPTREPEQRLALTGGEVVEGRWRRGRLWAGEVALDEPPRDRRREQRLAAGDG